MIMMTQIMVIRLGNHNDGDIDDDDYIIIMMIMKLAMKVDDNYNL